MFSRSYACQLPASTPRVAVAFLAMDVQKAAEQVRNARLGTRNGTLFTWCTLFPGEADRKVLAQAGREAGLTEGEIQGVLRTA
jgi:hypothetical protein